MVFNSDKGLTGSIERTLLNILIIKDCKNLAQNRICVFLFNLGNEILKFSLEKNDLFLSQIVSNSDYDLKCLFENYDNYLHINKITNKQEYNLNNYFRGPHFVLRRFGLSIHKTNFSKHFTLKILTSGEFSPIKSIMPKLIFLKNILTNNLLSFRKKNILHFFLSKAMIKYRFISFLLFGKSKNLLKQNYLPNYKVKFFKKYVINVRSEFMLLTDSLLSKDLFKFQKYLMLIQIISMKNFIGVKNENEFFNERKMQREYLNYQFYVSILEDLLK